LQNHPTRAAAAVTGAVLIAAAAPAATHWSGSLGFGQAAALKAGSGAGLGIHVSPSAASHSADPAAHSTHALQHNQAPQAVYANPLRDVTGLLPERIDQGVDFTGAGPVYPLGDAIITNASSTNYGWPDGGWITYRLTDGPGAGLTVFIAEDVRPTVSVGQHVTSKTVIANMFHGNAGIETGWGMASGFTAESQLAEAGGISGAGPFPTNVGLNFEELLQALGVPAANNRSDYPSGVLPASYPSDWATALGTQLAASR
jgi:murein DD-endopeptidase MepM/ murein hydrolase activator NlpD